MHALVFLAASVIHQLMHEGEVPGVSMVVIRDRAIVEQQVFGVANAATRKPLTRDAIFESASLAKPVFAYAVMKLVDRGVLSLDVPLSAYLDEPVTDPRMKRITARMVLTHTTGYQNEVMPGQELTIQFEPGSRFSYSGAGFFHLQRVVEHVTKKPLGTLMQELVFTPLGMRDSGYVWLPEYDRRKVFGHNAASLVMERRRPMKATVASLHTTPADFARFTIAAMKETAMIAPQVDAGKGISWGLGWAIDRNAFWHWGENNGDTHTFVMARRDGSGVVVFTNSGNGHSIMPELVATALDGDHSAAFAFMGYESYRSPSRVLQRDILARGAEAALAGEITLTEQQLNRIGYVLLARKRLPDAIAVFRRNVATFPQSANAYDSLGEAYMLSGERANAIANYRKSLELDPKNTSATAMLQQLDAMPAGRWIGALKAPDQPPLALVLDGMNLQVWLKNSERRCSVIGGENAFTTTLADGVRRGELTLPNHNLKGAITLVRESDGERLFREGLLAPETYLLLAERATTDEEALLWLTRARADKRAMNDALLWSGRALQRVRATQKFRELYRDPVAAHPELSQAQHAVRIEQNVLIPMRDGVRLLADIFRPDEDGRFPVILLRSPYGRGQDVPPDGVGHFASRGYVVVVQSVRGTAGSEGEFLPWINERKDGYDTIDWVSKQPWSNGRVGMLGLSYLGQTQWTAAVEAHPALKCIIPEVSGSDHFLDTPYDHGILRLSLLPWARGIMQKPKGVTTWPKLNDDLLTALPLSKLDEVYTGETRPVWQFLLDADTPRHWSRANFLSDLAKVRIPVLNISGWWDGEATSSTYNYRAMRALGRDDQWLIYGPWEHVWNQSTRFADVEYGPAAKIDFRSLSVRWFDQWLKEKDVAMRAVPRVQVFVTGANEWRNLRDWPDPDARPLRLHLANGRLTATQESARPATYVYDPAAVKTAGNGIIPEDTTALKIDPSANDMVLFESEPFESATTLSGPATLDLTFSTSARDVDFFVVLFDRDPSGVARALSGPGKMRMRFRDGFDKPRPLTPDEIATGPVMLRPFAHQFAKGHRLGILIRSEWFPSFERNLNTGERSKDATRMEVATERIFPASALNVWQLERRALSPSN
ncbi:MAG TPA: CocE/NonD family hydrolase [Thermoanaerobaculia bacterium]|nr:CocE/NonD family hydrolase [Thermoanaerobaculia bacterium]